MIADVVYGKRGGGPAHGGRFAVRPLDQRGSQAGLPVVAMDNVGLKTDFFREPQGRVGKKGESLQVVIVIAPPVSVKPRPFVQVLPIDQINGDTAPGPGLYDVRAKGPAAQGDLQVANQRFQDKFATPYGCVKGQDEPNIGAETL